jgi:hypothetical protein
MDLDIFYAQQPNIYKIDHKDVNIAATYLV